MGRKELIEAFVNHPKFKDGSAKVKVTVAKEK